MAISLETLTIIIGILAVIPGIVFLLKYFNEKRSFETGQDNKEFLKLTSSLIAYPSWEQEREARAWQFRNEIDAMTQGDISGSFQVIGGAYVPLPEDWPVGRVYSISKSSCSAVVSQHENYPETLVSEQPHCQFCGNSFVPDKFGRCSSCGGPQ